MRAPDGQCWPVMESLDQIIVDLINTNQKYPNRNIIRDMLKDRTLNSRAPAIAMLEEAEYPSASTPRPMEDPSLEHIMPRILDKDWHSHIIQHNGIDPSNPARSDDAVNNYHRRHVDYMGNQTLLLPRENGSLSNRSYDKKRLVYGNSTFRITGTMPRFTVWDHDSIMSRQKRLASRITSSIELSTVIDHIRS